MLRLYWRLIKGLINNMGQKVHPYLFRLGNIFDWKSRWFSNPKEYAKYLEQDIRLRKWVGKRLKEARIERMEIERSRGNMILNISSAKPGVIIGRGGAGLEELKKGIKLNFPGIKENIEIRIQEISNPYLSSQFLVDQIISEIERRIPYRRTMKQAIEQATKAQAKGIKVQVSGRLNGAEIARQETLSAGKVPLHTIRANIDYSRGTAFTTYGTIGVCVWVYKGEVFNVASKEG